LVIAVKISIQNHEISNTPIEQLWDEVHRKGINRDDWHAFARARLVPTKSEGHESTRTVTADEKGLVQWLMDAVTGVN
jgi:hypothetical protein